jgi:hypothetical protein
LPFFLATFLAAFFFFFAMVMAPCHERPDSQHTSDPSGTLREGSDDDGGTIRDPPSRAGHESENLDVNECGRINAEKSGFTAKKRLSSPSGREQKYVPYDC